MTKTKKADVAQVAKRFPKFAKAITGISITSIDTIVKDYEVNHMKDLDTKTNVDSFYNNYVAPTRNHARFDLGDSFSATLINGRLQALVVNMLGIVPALTKYIDYDQALVDKLAEHKLHVMVIDEQGTKTLILYQAQKVNVDPKEINKLYVETIETDYSELDKDALQEANKGIIEAYAKIKNDVHEALALLTESASYDREHALVSADSRNNLILFHKLQALVAALG